MTPQIEHEWRKHRSSFALTWLATMRRRRKVVDVVEDGRQHDDLMAVVLRGDRLPRKKSAIEKDARLVCAAWQADSTVVSLDDRVRKLLAGAVTDHKPLASVVWVNPDNPKNVRLAGSKAGPGPRRRGAWAGATP